MDKQILNTVCEQIYRRFPEIAGKQPKVQTRPDDQFLLIFQGSARTSDGRDMPCTVRVVATSTGKINKVTTSR